MSARTFLIVSWSILLLFSCANIQGISGGEDDKQPPQVDLKKSSQDKPLRYDGKPIVLHFNEWIKLDQPATNIFISPSTEYPIQSKLKGKSVRILFDSREKLKENTTYTIQFGQAIKDITAGNVAQNLAYTFSTGDYIDSLTLEGKVVDAFSGEPKPKVVACLYQNLSDTAFLKTRPLYISFTDSKGNFKFQHLAAATYRLFAVEDKNTNYYFDQPTESIAMLDSAFQLSNDNLIKVLRLSENVKPIKLIRKSFKSGLIKLLWNQSVSKEQFKINSPVDVQVLQKKDTSLIYYQSKDSIQLQISFGQSTDSIDLPPFLSSNVQSEKLQAKSSFIHQKEMIRIECLHPILSIDSYKIKLQAPKAYKAQVNPTQPGQLEIVLDNLPEKEIMVILDSGAIKMPLGITNRTDTFQFFVKPESALSKLNLSIDSLPNGFYILRLISRAEVYREDYYQITNGNLSVDFTHLEPIAYSVELIEDSNQNKKWDGINYDEHFLPEKIYRWILEPLRADWDQKIKLKP